MSQDSTISALPSASALTGAEIIPIDQGQTKQTPLSVVKTFVATGPFDSNNITFTQSGTPTSGSVAAKLQQIVSVKDPPYNAKGDGVTDDTSAIQAAENALDSAGGGILWWPGGSYKQTSAIIKKKKVIWQGSGIGRTILLSSFTGDAVQSTWAINSSNAVDIAIRDMTIQNTNGSNTGGGFVDVGGTYISLYKLQVIGFKYGVIWDQSELFDADLCRIEGQITAGMWMVNGADHTIGALGFFTNRGSVMRTQFNEGSSVVCIADDGGYARFYVANNMNGGDKHFRLAATRGVFMAGNESETSTTTSIHFAATKLSGAGIAANTSAHLTSNTISSGLAIPLITFDVGGLLNLSMHSMEFENNNVGGSPTSGLTNVASITGSGNSQQGTGTNTNAVLANFTTGTTTTDSAPTGAIGEIVSSTLIAGSAVSLTNNTAADVTTISLTAGDWDVDGVIAFGFGATTSYTILQGSTSTTSATMGAVETQFVYETAATVPTNNIDMKWSAPITRLSIGTTTTVYLVALGVFSVSTLKAYGTIRARRVR